MNFKKLILIMAVIVIIVVLLLAITFKNNKENDISGDSLSVVVTNFVAYDFIRQIANDKVDLKLLLSPRNRGT